MAAKPERYYGTWMFLRKPLLLPTKTMMAAQLWGMRRNLQRAHDISTSSIFCFVNGSDAISSTLNELSLRLTLPTTSRNHSLKYYSIDMPTTSLGMSLLSIHLYTLLPLPRTATNIPMQIHCSTQRTLLPTRMSIGLSRPSLQPP